MSMETGPQRFMVDITSVGKRLDRFLATRLGEASRTQIQQRIAGGRIRIDGAPAKAALLLRAGQVIEVDPEFPAEPLALEAQDIPLTVLFEDECLLVINKPAGLVVHPAPGNWQGTLVNALLHHWGGTREGLDAMRPGIVHRLDKDTSGVLVIAKDALTLAHLAKQFHDRLVDKQYVAIVWGKVAKDRGVMSGPIGRHPVHRKQMAVRPGGRVAETLYEVVERLPTATLLRLTPHTGRTHQLRVHLAALGHPIIGDTTYGTTRTTSPPIDRQALHAERLRIEHPRTHETLSFHAPLATDMLRAVESLRESRMR